VQRGQRCAGSLTLPNTNAVIELYLLVVCYLFDVRLVAFAALLHLAATCDGHPGPQNRLAAVAAEVLSKLCGNLIGMDSFTYVGSLGFVTRCPLVILKAKRNW
jgi:hypothetical protein